MDIEQLCKACEDGDNDKVEEIMASGDVNVNDKDSYGWTPLHYAMKSNLPSIVRTLLASENTRLDVTRRCGLTALHYACYNNNVQSVKVFTSHTRCTDHVLNMKTSDVSTAVMLAVISGHLDIVRVLAQLPGTDMDTKNSSGMTMMEVAIDRDEQDIVKFLEERNCIQGAEGGDRDTSGSLMLSEIVEDNIEAVDDNIEADLEEKHKDQIDEIKGKQ